MQFLKKPLKTYQKIGLFATAALALSAIAAGSCYTIYRQKSPAQEAAISKAAYEKGSERTNEQQDHYESFNAKEKGRIEGLLNEYIQFFNSDAALTRKLNPRLHTADDFTGGAKVLIPSHQAKGVLKTKKTFFSSSDELDYFLCERAKRHVEGAYALIAQSLVQREYVKNDDGQWKLTFRYAVDCGCYFDEDEGRLLRVFSKK